MSENSLAAGPEGSTWRPLHLGGDVERIPRVARLTPGAVEAAISDHNARVVLAACVTEGRAVRDIKEATGLPLATTYRQVHRLLDLGVLIVERSALTPEGKRYDLFRSRILEAHIDVVAGRANVRWTPNDAVEARFIGLWDAVRAEARGSS